MIPEGESSVELVLTPLADDAHDEGDESVTLEVIHASGYHGYGIDSNLLPSLRSASHDYPEDVSLFDPRSDAEGGIDEFIRGFAIMFDQLRIKLDTNPLDIQDEFDSTLEAIAEAVIWPLEG
ncbi:hypothetical protein RMSM_05001 [Rhodopirellula maiorica SM1]|uniref:Uncharacterized protein n=1 Tax=Rhodopirellula maiorica SM1 TaxID=1265738 RepID=M5RG12_9BACT|nr:hypothetical protein RMSM_05001 [Rhodopirellula maiorica SM1]